jgi:hypothetical protein
MEMKGELFTGKSTDEIEIICKHIIGGIWKSPEKLGDADLTKAYRDNRSIYSACKNIAYEFTASSQVQSED